MTTTMDPTTLVTFLFKAPPEARTVELLGSWDNFRQPYRMHNDLKRGAGFWSGCFKFHNIIFDGDKSSWTKPRTGGLKQGGTYWYYYRLDDEIEAYDDSKEYTTGCPLLPGQTVNVIEVPMEVEERPNRSRSASVDVVGTLASLSSMHTLDPGDKFAVLDPPPISKVHDRCRSDLALSRRLENKADSTSDSSAPPPGRAHSEHIQNHSAIEQPPGRFYANSGYADDRSSTYSRRSWCSTAASFGHSSVVNVYGVDSPLIDQAGSVSLSFPDVPRPNSRSHADVPHGELDRFDFHPQTDGDAINTGNESSHFEFGLPLRDVNYNTEHSAEVDHDFSSNYRPVSPRDVRIHGSRPTTSHRAEDRRPRLFSPPNSVTDTRVIGDVSSDPHAPPHSSAEPTGETRGESVSPHQLDDHGAEAENDTFDLCSPTFSAATVSSTAGVNTPYRLSVIHSSTSYSNPASDSIESVAERLRSLGSIDDDPSLPPPILEEVDEPASLFTRYALPSEAVQSTQTLGKLSSGQTSTIGALPTIMMAPTEETSFADSIFSELSYLGTSAA